MLNNFAYLSEHPVVVTKLLTHSISLLSTFLAFPNLPHNLQHLPIYSITLTLSRPSNISHHPTSTPFDYPALLRIIPPTQHFFPILNTLHEPNIPMHESTTYTFLIILNTSLLVFHRCRQSLLVSHHLVRPPQQPSPSSQHQGRPARGTVYSFSRPCPRSLQHSRAIGGKIWFEFKLRGVSVAAAAGKTQSHKKEALGPRSRL